MKLFTQRIRAVGICKDYITIQSPIRLDSILILENFSMCHQAIICPKCKGEGKLYYDDDTYDTCYICDGKRYVAIDVSKLNKWSFSLE